MTVGHGFRIMKAKLYSCGILNRMGISNDITMHFDLGIFINCREDLQSLIQHFEHEEIDGVVKRMPPDKVLGLDGFNGYFIKKCWPIMKNDFYTLCNDFYSGSLDIEGINKLYITLIPKTGSPETVSDYRPISLMKISPKIFSKILADRLQAEIICLVHKNQYDFIKTRTIQDYLACSFEYIHQCHQSKREAIILNLDFEKTFDTVEHQAILTMMEHLGFLDKWLDWINVILSSGSSAILLNGVPGKFFKCKRGVRQGDPLSPLLFVLAVELLHILINCATSINLLQAPIPQPCDDFLIVPIVQYPNDTLLIMPADGR